MLEGLTVEENGKSPTKMAYWENEMRSSLADIQKKYKEKYKELYKLDHQLKRIEARNKKHRVSRDSSGVEHDNEQVNISKSPSSSPKKHHRSEDLCAKSNNTPAPPPSKSLPLHPDIIDAQLKEIKKLRECQLNTATEVSSNGGQKTTNKLKTHSESTREKSKSKIEGSGKL